MSDEERVCRCGVSEGLRLAIERGWRGLALGCVPAAGPVTAVCAAPADRIDALAGRGLAVGLPPRRPCGHPAHRRITIALAGDHGVALNLDLAFADARALAARLGRDGCLRLVWARAEDAATARVDLCVLGPAISERLRGDAAHSGEWRVADPHPDGFSRLRWWRESMRSARPRLARGDLAGAPVVVIAPSVDGTAAGSIDRADLVLAFPSGPPLPEAPARIRLRFEDDEQRRFAASLADQERVAILMLDVGGAWLAQVELELGEDSRALIADASRAR
jgi:hypothetical protein